MRVFNENDYSNQDLLIYQLEKVTELVREIHYCDEKGDSQKVLEMLPTLEKELNLYRRFEKATQS